MNTRMQLCGDASARLARDLAAADENAKAVIEKADAEANRMIKEAGATNPEAFAEVWNLAKPVNGQSGWLLAGIQQLN